MDKNYIKSGTYSSIQLKLLYLSYVSGNVKLKLILKCISKYIKTENDHCFHIGYISVGGENTDSI